MRQRVLNPGYAFIFLVLLVVGSSFVFAKVGDNWETTRGDGTPGYRYSAATRTTSGRIIAVGTDGVLMFSDDNGASWAYDRIEIDGVNTRGVYAEIYQVRNGPLIAVRTTLEDSSARYFKWQVQSWFLTSTDNGDSWSMAAFPVDYCTLPNNDSFRFYGVHIWGFHEGPGGSLLAYGTTSGTNTPGALWSIGGAIFRQTGSGWTQAHFGYGPVDSMTDANGRTVATSYNAILDSGDGAGWNGYQFDDAQVTVNGELLDYDSRDRLRMLDIAYVNGTYIAQGGTFVPLKDTDVDTGVFDTIYKYSSSNPFDGARMWTAYEESNYVGPYITMGNNVVATGPKGAYVTSSGGAGYSLVNADMHAWTHVVTPPSGGSSFAVESADLVWQTTTNGSSWSKVWEIDEGPDIEPIGVFDDILYGRSVCDGPVWACRDTRLWTSYDNGSTWLPAATDFYPRGDLVQLDNGNLVAPAGDNDIAFSSDGGFTWSTVTIAQGAPDFETDRVILTPTGRLIAPVEGLGFEDSGLYYVSDDNGETWESRNARTFWQETTRGSAVMDSGRIVVATNSSSIASFMPRLRISDDNGDTWSLNTTLQRLPDLDGVFGDDSTKVMDIKKLVKSSTGRLFLQGKDEILTSDDEGDTWEVRINYDRMNGPPNLFWEIHDIIEVDGRWFGLGYYRTPWPQSRDKYFLLTSDDDGATWGQTPFDTRQENTLLVHLGVGLNNRLLIFGENSAIFVSDPEELPPVQPDSIHIREGSIEDVTVQRPPLAGAIEVRYSAVQRTAIAGTDYVAAGGYLAWGDEENDDKTIRLETIDNDSADDEREFLLQLVFETDEGLMGQIETSVIIDDDDGILAGLLIENSDNFNTSETGNSVDIRFILESKPTSNVIISIDNLDTTEGWLSESVFTFTPENWNQWQSVTVTGIDEGIPDGDASYELHFNINSDDSQYSILPATPIRITNLGDEPYVVGGEKLDQFISSLKIDATPSPGSATFTFKVPSSFLTLTQGITITSELSSDFEDWQPGPDPVQGATENGTTTYSLTLSPSDPALFARLNFDWQ